jgi:elongator complex protein 3
MLNDLILSLLKNKVKSQKALEKAKKTFAKQKGVSLPKHYQLLKSYRDLVSKGELEKSPHLEKLLQAKPVRTLSGVTPLTVLLKPYPCPGECVYCPDQKGIPKSYLADEPAVLRALQLKFDARRQVNYRLKVFKLMGHQVAKVELIILGGTFSAYPRAYRQKFIKDCFEACNQKRSKSLFEAQKTNETASRRIIGLTIETRPDLIDDAEIKFLRSLGITRVELGVQSLDSAVLKKIKRGHSLKEVITATKLLKNAGFKVCYHLMPGLPGSNFQKDVLMFKKAFRDSRFRPDFLKIYPCVVLPETPLYDLWQKGNFKPLADQELVKLLLKIKKIIPPYVRINRLGRDIPLGNVVAGYRYSHIRQLVQKKLLEKGLSCQCIRCREAKAKSSKIENCKLKITKYPASGGQELFLEFIDSKNRLHALLRLRLPLPKSLEKGSLPLFKSLKNAALVRELHVYGQSLDFSQKKNAASQHQGLGKKLLAQAEKIASDAGFAKLAVISGVGARQYYRRLGFRLKQTYLVKSLA